MGALKEGCVKYSAMCNDDGRVIDDGVVVRTGLNDYYFTTSTICDFKEWRRLPP